MKLCTKARVTGHHAGEDGREVIDDLEIIDVSLVEDSHTPGFDSEGFLHLPTTEPLADGRAVTVMAPNGFGITGTHRS